MHYFQAMCSFTLSHNEMYLPIWSWSYETSACTGFISLDHSYAWMFHELSTIWTWPNFISAFQSCYITLCRVCTSMRFTLFKVSVHPYRWLNTNTMWTTFNGPLNGCRSQSVSSCVSCCFQLLLIFCPPRWHAIKFHFINIHSAGGIYGLM